MLELSPVTIDPTVAAAELLPVVDGATVIGPVLDDELSFSADEAPEMNDVPVIALKS